MSAVLSVRDLGKRYGATVGVEGVSFEVGRGEIVGLLGPNGAGKTTIISTILGVLEPSAGTIVAGRAPSWSALAGAAALAAL